jgi:hypothetical protein
MREAVLGAATARERPCPRPTACPAPTADSVERANTQRGRQAHGGAWRKACSRSEGRRPGRMVWRSGTRALPIHSARLAAGGGEVNAASRCEPRRRTPAGLQLMDAGAATQPSLSHRRRGRWVSGPAPRANVVHGLPASPWWPPHVSLLGVTLPASAAGRLGLHLLLVVVEQGLVLGLRAHDAEGSHT